MKTDKRNRSFETLMLMNEFELLEELLLGFGSVKLKTRTLI